MRCSYASANRPLTNLAAAAASVFDNDWPAAAISNRSSALSALMPNATARRSIDSVTFFLTPAQHSVHLRPYQFFPFLFCLQILGFYYLQNHESKQIHHH